MGAQDNQLRLVTQDPKGKPRIQARLGSGNTIRVAGITNPISKAPAPGKFPTHPCEYLPSWSYYPYDILLSLSPQHPKHVPRIDKILRSCTLALHPCLGLGEGAHTYAWLSREAPWSPSCPGDCQSGAYGSCLWRERAQSPPHTYNHSCLLVIPW